MWLTTITARIAAAVAAVAAVLTARSVAAKSLPSADPDPSPERVGGPAQVEDLALKLAALLGANGQQTRWLANMHLAQANSESGSKMNPSAANRTASEREASKRLFFAERGDRTNAQILGQALGKNIASDASWYTPGSGGFFGLFAVNLLNLVHNRDARGDGFTSGWIFDPWSATVGYAAFCSKLVRRGEWSRSTRDARAIKVGGAAGSLMDDPHKERYQKAVSNLDKAISRQKLPASFREEKPGIKDLYSGHDWLAVWREGRRRGY